MSGSVAYGIADIPGLDAAIQAVSGFSALARRLVDVPSWVESRVGERRVALTRVDWAGSLRTYCAPGGDPGLASQHARLVAQVLATRREWLRLLLLVIAGAARLGAALAGGPFSLLALGAIWNYLQEVVQQFQALTEN